MLCDGRSQDYLKCSTLPIHTSNYFFFQLYFKGPYTSLKVRAGRKQWNYFIEQGPKFDDWFYENHDTADSPILIPGSVEINLFSTVLKYLKLMFRFHLNHQA